MSLENILQELRSERARIDQAISALENRNGLARRERPKAGPRRRGRMSAAARAKISRLMKKRWAARKKAGKKTLA